MTKRTRIHWNTQRGKAASTELVCDNCQKTLTDEDTPLPLNNSGNQLHYCSKGCYNAAAYLIEQVTGKKLQLD